MGRSGGCCAFCENSSLERRFFVFWIQNSEIDQSSNARRPGCLAGLRKKSCRSYNKVDVLATNDVSAFK